MIVPSLWWQVKPQSQTKQTEMKSKELFLWQFSITKKKAVVWHRNWFPYNSNGDILGNQHQHHLLTVSFSHQTPTNIQFITVPQWCIECHLCLNGTITSDECCSMFNVCGLNFYVMARMSSCLPFKCHPNEIDFLFKSSLSFPLYFTLSIFTIKSIIEPQKI